MIRFAWSWHRPALAIYWVALAIGTHWPRLHIFAQTGEGLSGLALDKPVHFAAYAVLTLLIFRASPAGPNSRLITNLAVTALIAAAYSFLDEWSQQWAQRSFSAGDLGANLLGVLGTFVALVILRAQATGPSTGEPARFVGHARLVGALTLISRFTGLLREAYLGAVFGLSGISSAFMIGFMVPNLFRRLFGEGALSSAFIPVYTRRLADNPAAARRLASACIALMLVVLAAITVLGELILTAMLASRHWSDDSALAIRLTMVMLPYMPLICLVALLGGIQQVHKRFGPPAAAPILLNVIVIVGIYLAGFGGDDDPSQRSSIFTVAICVLIAGVAQLAWQIFAVLRFESFTINFTGTATSLASIFRTMLPMVLGLAVFQINTLLDVLIAFAFSPKLGGPATLELFGAQYNYPIASGGATAGLVFAQRLYQFPLGISGIAIATAVFPALARYAASNNQAPFADTVRHGLRLTVFIGMPASVGLIIVALPLARLIFEHKQVRVEDSLLIASILTGYASAVWAYSMTHVLTRAFHAHRNAVTPLKISVAMVVCNLALNLTLIWSLGAAGLAWSTAVCAVAQVVLLIIALRRYVEAPISAAVWRSWGRTALLTAVMAALLLPISLLVDSARMDKTNAALLLTLLVITGTAVFALGAMLCKADELTWLLRRRAN